MFKCKLHEYYKYPRLSKGVTKEQEAWLLDYFSGIDPAVIEVPPYPNWLNPIFYQDWPQLCSLMLLQGFRSILI